MNMKKKGIAGTLLIYAIIFGVYNMLLFMIFDDKNTIFWISYAYMLAAYLLHIGCVAAVFKNLSVQTVFFNIPLISFSIYFVGAEFFVSFVMMIFRDLVNTKVCVALQTILLAAFLIVAVVSILTRDAVQNVDNKIKKNVNFIKGINVDVEMLMQRSNDPTVTAALKKLSETIKYSDPMTNEIVSMQEQMIMQYMGQMRTVFDSGDMEQVKSVCGQIELLFIERNKKLMLTK